MNKFDYLKTDFKNYFKDKEVNKLFNNCFFNTLETTLTYRKDKSVFILTGDIPAMWLRDSAIQMLPYLYFIKDKNIKDLIKGVIKAQFQYILIDSYSNAFMIDDKHISEWDGKIKTDYLPKIVWERKYELDSLCFPLFLITKYYEFTNDLKIFDDLFIKTFDRIIETIKIESNHNKKSKYYFIRDDEIVGVKKNIKEDKGLVWSGFRPSDDMCKYNYHIPDNMFLVSVLYKLEPIFKLLKDNKRAKICRTYIDKLKPLIEKYGIKKVNNKLIYISETNCLKKYTCNDDANIPSLLSIPFLEYPFINKEIYSNTRKYILSKKNEFYYKGKLLEGIGSPHTPKDRVWPLAITMQGITSNSDKEIKKCLDQILVSSNKEYLLHEGVDTNDVSKYSRPWFSMANALFCYFLLIKKSNFNK